MCKACMTELTGKLRERERSYDVFMRSLAHTRCAFCVWISHVVRGWFHGILASTIDVHLRSFTGFALYSLLLTF